MNDIEIMYKHILENYCISHCKVVNSISASVISKKTMTGTQSDSPHSFTESSPSDGKGA